MKKLAALVMLGCMNAAFAQQHEPPRDGHRGPPREALAACKGKQSGDTVQARMPRGDTRTGTCRLVMVVDHDEGEAGGAQRQPPRR